MHLVFCIEIIKSDENIYWPLIKKIIIGTNIWCIPLLCELSKYGMFIPMIALEFNIFTMICLINILPPEKIYYIFYNKSIISTTSEYPTIIINIPQLAIPANPAILESTTFHIPQASIINMRLLN